MADDWGKIYYSHNSMTEEVGLSLLTEADSAEEVSKAPKITPKKKWEGEDEDEDSAPVCAP
jgi:hypothetical protein